MTRMSNIGLLAAIGALSANAPSVPMVPDQTPRPVNRAPRKSPTRGDGGERPANAAQALASAQAKRDRKAAKRLRDASRGARGITGQERGAR